MRRSRTRHNRNTGKSMSFDERTFRPGAVKSRDSALLKHINQLIEDYPAAGVHREALNLLGSDFIDARKRQGAERGCWTALVRFGRVVERSLGLTREVMVYYTPYRDLQLRTYGHLPQVRNDLSPSPTQDLFLLYSPDPIAPRKIDDWGSREPFDVVSLP